MAENLLTPRLSINPRTAGFKELAPVAKVLLDGGLIAGPTQSFYALMALADKPAALERLAALKPGRSNEQAFLLLIDQESRVPCYAREPSEDAHLLMSRFWPGLLTLLFTGQSGLHHSLLGAGRTVGLRVEGLAITRRLIRMVDRGLTGTSANPHQCSPSTCADDVQKYFGDQIDLILDAGPTTGGKFSTIVDVSTSDPLVIRKGAITVEDLTGICSNLRHS